MVLRKVSGEEKKKDEYMYFDTLVKRFYRTGVVEVVEVKCDECDCKTFYLKKLSPKHKVVAICSECSKIISMQ